MLGLQNSSFLLAKSSLLSRNSNIKPRNERTGRLFTSIFQVVFFQAVSGNGLVLLWCKGSSYSSIHFTYGSGLSFVKIGSYYSDMSECLYAAEASPVHKTTFSEELNSSIKIKSSLRSQWHTECLKMSKSNGIANLLSNIVSITF